MPDDLDDFQYQDPQPHSRWDTLWLLVAALAAVFSAATQYQSHSRYAIAFLVVVGLAVAARAYRPVAAWIQKRSLRGRRNRVARKEWPAFLRFEKRFAEFLSNDDPRNLRSIIRDIYNQRDDHIEKVCPPDYIKTFYPLLSSRHAATHDVRESDFRLAVSELVTAVASYNDEYILKPLKRFDMQRLTQLPLESRKHREGTIEEFRERWVRFLDDLAEFIAARNNDFGYEPYHEALHAHFERPKKLA